MPQVLHDLGSIASLVFFRLKMPDFLSVRPTHECMKGHNDLMRSMWLASFFNICLRSGDVLVVGALTDPTTTGLYIVASRIASLAATPATLLDQVVAPRVAEAAEYGEKNRLRDLSWEYAVLSFVGCVVLLGFLALFGVQFIRVLFGDAYQESLTILWVLLAGHVANAMTGPTGILLSMTGSHRVSIVVSGASVICYFFLLYLWAPTYFAMGAASAFSVAIGLKVLLQLLLVIRRLRFNPTVFQWPRFGKVS